jgi:DNA polymerase III delta prime subunit
MSDLRRQAKIFYNKLDLHRPIEFGETRFVENAFDASVYVKDLHLSDGQDLIEDIASQIDMSDSAGAYLFTGNRGTGKTTELLRLADLLQRDEFNCEVFYIDIGDYLYMSDPVEISDFLIAILGGLSEKFSQRFKEDPVKGGYFQRFLDLLTRTSVSVTEAKASLGPAEFKLAFQQNPTFKQHLQQQTRGIVEKLVADARDFTASIKHRIGQLKTDDVRKVVLIVDSFERLKGTFQNEKDVFASVAALFSNHASNLRFPGISMVYTVPPYLPALEGSIGKLYAGGRINSLPSLHIYEKRPDQGARPVRSSEGVARMTATVERRFPNWAAFFTQAQLDRLAESSGGDLRNFFNMLRLSLASGRARDAYPVPDLVIKNAEDSVRSDMLPIAADDREWLAKIMKSHDVELPSQDDLPKIARLEQGSYVLRYRNGDTWYDVHPLIQAQVMRGHDG